MRKILYLGVFVFLVAFLSEGSSSLTYLVGITILFIFLIKRKKAKANRRTNNYKSHGQRGNYQGRTSNRPSRESAASFEEQNHYNFDSDYKPTPKPDNYGYGNNYSTNNSSNQKSAKKKAEEEAYWKKKNAEDAAYEHRKYGAPEWKVRAADDDLGRTQRERDYENEKWGYNPMCNECNRPENECKCCDDCGRYNCVCCRECGEARCVCCSKCQSSPCQCCSKCNEPDNYCRCCDRCGETERNCRCCDRCGRDERYCGCN